MEPRAAELTGVMGHDVEGDKLAAERERRMVPMACGRFVVSTEMSYTVISERSLVTLFFVNSHDLSFLSFFNSIQLQSRNRSLQLESINLSSTAQ